ncbi:hypothetical protein [Sphingomonas bacterium]|uniref:hypothetical protein n=1 Tax=Sphingomonas bacterium TaxID=1895847 RepID=UPI0026071820|nr:hypothetical protein [Sphingomonas bacterium]
MPAIAQDMPAAPPPAPMPQTAPMPPAPPPVDPAAVAPPTDPVAPAPMPPAPMADAAPAPTTDGNYPMCTKTIVDHCTERSNARGERLHSTPRKPG